MDFSLIIVHVITALWYLVPIAIIVGVIKSPQFRGVAGEVFVNLLLKMALPNEKYDLVNNLIFPTDDGTTQIDHVVVSKYGVFVIEKT